MAEWITEVHLRLILTMIAMILTCLSIITMTSSNRRVAIRFAYGAIGLAVINIILAFVWP